MECKDDTDTCTEGVCECGSGTSLVCDAKSEFPLCSNSTCACSKVKRKYEKGDGTSQGSCKSNLHKCQSDGTCAQCIYDTQCTGLSNKCLNGICVCGDSSAPCDATFNSLCNSAIGNGKCMCGANPECFKKVQDVETKGIGVKLVQIGADCDKTKCSFDKLLKTQCKIQRGPEACELITKYYNPLYLEGKSDDNDNPLDFSCDDDKGKHVGTYQCLGDG